MKREDFCSNYLTGRISGKLYNFREKDRVISDHITYMLIRTLSMFKYGGDIPDTLSPRTMELYFQIDGFAGFYDYKDKLYCQCGSLGGEPNYNYMPTIFTFANPALKISRNLKIDEECVIIPNDEMYLGLYPLMLKYSTAMCENELSLFISDLWARIQALISASDDATKESANKFLGDIEKGALGTIGNSAFLEGIKAQPIANGSGTRGMTELIEYQQYLRAGFFNDIGLNANYNMKRESLNSNESQLNDDMLYPLIDNMLKCRREGIEKVNKMFGTNITVDFNSSWKDNEIEKDLTLENMDDPAKDAPGGETNVSET